MLAPEEVATAVAALIDGDRVAFMKVARYITHYLVRLRAYDFRDEWPDLVQEVVAAVSAAARAGKLRDEQALGAFVLAVTRHKLVDRVKAQMRIRGQAQLAWELAIFETFDPLAPLPPHLVVDLRRALEGLPKKKTEVLLRVYVEGKTYEEVAEETGIPLGTLKRYLRDGLAELRRRLDDRTDEGDSSS